MTNITETLICPNAGSCEVYKVYNQEAQRGILNVIRREGDYVCVALDYLMAGQTRDVKSGRLLSHTGYKGSISCGCAYLQLLNKLFEGELARIK